MLIPSIDLAGGKIVQLIGRQEGWSSTTFWWDHAICLIPVQLIDLDAAMGRNRMWT